MNGRHAVTAALAVPPAAATLFLAVTLAAAGVGAHPLWPHAQVTMAEAAATRDPGEIARRIDAGEDPNAAGDVRASLLFDRAIRVTPIEAAVAARDEDTLTVLLDLGATIDAAQWVRLRCLAEGDAVRDVLDERRPPGAVLECPPGLQWQ